MPYRRGGPKVLAIVLAGGEGKRLMPLTADRAKPAVPFGGIYRLIDFALSNVVNSGYLKSVVLTQYKSHSLDRHITKTWRMSNMLGNYVTPVPAQQRIDKNWYLGSANAIYQSLNLIHDENPDIVVVVGRRPRLPHGLLADGPAAHRDRCRSDRRRHPPADLPRRPVRRDRGRPQGPPRIDAFREKPKDALGLPDSPDEVLASMGNYVFDASVLIDAVTRDATREGSKHDMGGDIVPAFVDEGAGFVYDFKDNVIPGATERDQAYWRDVGTLDSYWEANMDLVSVHPVFNLYNYEWPIYTDYGPYPPAKLVHGAQGKFGEAHNSAVSPGVVISGATVTNSVLSPRVHVHSATTIDDSVLLDGVEVGRHAVVRRAIIDKNVYVPEKTSIGVDREADEARGFVVTESGLTIVAKGQEVAP